MRLIDLIPNPHVLYALEPHELALRMLPVLAAMERQPPSHELSLPVFLRTVVAGFPPLPSQYPAEQSARVEEAVREAWAWLEGSGLLVEHRRYVAPHTVRSLSRRARQLAEEPDARKAFGTRWIPKDALHPSISEDVWALYHRGKYDTAVFEAMKAVEIAVRDAAGFSERDIGVPLMRKAFDPKNGPLTDVGVEEAEREARAHLFAGAIGSYKNPHSHRNVALEDPNEAAEIIMLANHLLRIVDARLALGGTP